MAEVIEEEPKHVPEVNGTDAANPPPKGSGKNRRSSASEAPRVGQKRSKTVKVQKPVEEAATEETTSQGT